MATEQFKAIDQKQRHMTNTLSGTVYVNEVSCDCYVSYEYQTKCQSGMIR